MWFSIIQERNNERFNQVSNGDERQGIDMRVKKLDIKWLGSGLDVKSKGKGQSVITLEFMLGEKYIWEKDCDFSFGHTPFELCIWYLDI